MRKLFFNNVEIEEQNFNCVVEKLRSMAATVTKLLFRGVTTMLHNRPAFFHELAEAYKPNIFRRRERILEIIKEKTEAVRSSQIAHKINIAKKYYMVEMAPPQRSEMQQLKTDIALIQKFFKSGCYKYMSIRQLWLLTLVCLEVFLWFFLGETIGKFHIVGYKV